MKGSGLILNQEITLSLCVRGFEESNPWIKSLSQTDRASKLSVGFTGVVEVGQYFMTKDSREQFYAKACREYTLPRSDGSSQPNGWIQGNTKIGPVLEVTTSCQYGKHGVEIRIWSVGQDNSQSLVRISYGTNKYVIDSNHNNTEIPANPHEDQTPQTSIKVIAARSKAKAKPQQMKLVDTPTIIPMHETLSHQNQLSLRTMSRRK